MRFSIIALSSFVTCAVFASPIVISGRGSDNGLSLSRRGPPGKTPPTTTKTTPKTSSKQPASKQPAGKQTHGKTAKSCPIKKKIKKRADEDVENAVNFAIEESSKTGRSSRTGRGAGKAYPILFKGLPAFVKLVKEKDETTLKNVENEARCTDAVGQYLAWAVKEGKEKEGGKKEPTEFFIITRNMGDTQENLIRADKSKKLKPADFVAVRQATVDRYKDKFGATNIDANVLTGNNFVYHVDMSGEEPVVHGEIIDWEVGKLDKDHAVPKPEIIEPDC